MAGRPTAFREVITEEIETVVRKLCSILGATDKQLANYFGVTEKTIDNWKNAHPEFFQSLKRGKDEKDAAVAASLLHRALGYSHPETKAQWVQGKDGKGRWEYAQMTKHYPPDTAAAIYWLNNRQPEIWKQTLHVEKNEKLTLVKALVQLEGKDALAYLENGEIKNGEAK